ncbi:TPA: hypothetical protein ACH3X1_004705 [Trebouxia sp. C0004]
MVFEASMTLTRSSASNCLRPQQATRPICQPFTAAKFGRRREHCVRQQRMLPQAKQSQEEGSNIQLPAILKIANGLAGSAASLVPASVPRPVAKLGVVGIGSLVALWLFGKVSLDTLYIHALCKHAVAPDICIGVWLPCMRHANSLLMPHAAMITTDMLAVTTYVQHIAVCS